MSMLDVYKGQADNIAAKIENKVSDLMQAVKKHPSMKKYSPHVRKGVQKEIRALLNHRMSAFSLKIDVDDINKWLDEYTPYAQASTTAYIQRVAKEKGFKTLTPEQVDYVKNALLNSMEPDEYFDWSTGEGVKIPLHGKALGTERDLAAKVATHVEWSVKKTVGNALKPENVIAFLVKNKKSLNLDNLDDENIVDYVDNIIAVASMSLYGESSSNKRKITERSIQNIDNALLHAAFTANTKMSNFSGALLRKIGTSTFVDNDTRLGEIKKEFNDKIGKKARKEQEDAQNYARLRALMDRFFTALRWSMHYKTGKMGTSTYTAENQYMKIELAILEFVANTTLPLKELVSRFERIFASNDNPEAVERLYMTEVLNAWWVNVSNVLGIDEDIALEIQSDIISEKSGEYIDGNAGHFERDIDREKEIQATFKELENALRYGVTSKVYDNIQKTDELVKKYVQAKKEAERWKKEKAANRRKEIAAAKKAGFKKAEKDTEENEDMIEFEKELAKERAKERRDTKKRLQDKVLDNFKAANMQNAEEVGVGERTIKVLDKATLNNLKYTLFGTNKKLTKSDFSKFLSAAYRVSGANDKGTKDLFIATHASLINAVFNNDDVFNKDVSPKFEEKFNKAKESLINYDEKLQAETKKEKDKADRERKKAIKDKLNNKRQKATQSDINEAVKAGKAIQREKDKADRERQREINREINRAKKAEQKAEEARQKAEEVANINTAMTNFIRASTSDFDADFRKLRNSSNRYLQQTTSRLKIDVVRKIGDSKLTRDLRTYRAAKNERHKAIVNSSVSDFITKANQSLDKWAQEVTAEAEKLYSDRKREKTKALGEIARLKKSKQSKINSEAREMKNEALEKFHDAIYS